jgi:hypothetical protein
MSGQTRGLVGAAGVFHIYRTNAKDVKGSGEDGKVLFEDLWECTKDEEGNYKPKYDTDGLLIPKVPVTEERHFHNKWTRRGLSYALYRMLVGHTPFNANVPEITNSNTTNPFMAFVLFSDDTANSKLGDVRPEWSESDGQYVTVLSPATNVAGNGRRGITLATTSGIFKRLSTLHVGTNPYGILEYTFYAEPNDPAVETGNTGLDNFPIKAVGLAAGIACGDGEANSKLGIRAICGLPPTFQGKSDRIYVHEGQQQGVDVVVKKYVLDDDEFGETVSVAGYIQDGELDEEQIDDTTTSQGASDTITKATRTIVLADAETALDTTTGFDARYHTRKVLRISGSGHAGNNRDFTIREVVNTTTVKVFEEPANDDAGNANAFVGSVWTVYAGHNAFDGRVENYGRVEVTDTGTYPVPNDTPGTIQTGEIWSSPDTGVTHTIGRIFGSTVNNLTGIRIMLPDGLNIDFVPNNFVIQVLNPAANGGNPRPGYNADWVTVSSGTKSGVGQNIYDAGEVGLQYTFDAINARGIRLTSIQAYDNTRHVQIAELMSFTYIQSGNELSLSGNNLRLKVKGAASYRQFELDNVAPTTSLTNIVNSINKAIRGYEMEALGSTFGYLWLRSTVSGNNADIFIDNVGGSGAATMLGFPTTATQKTGITQPVTKLPEDAVTIVYRVFLTGNVPGGYPA